MKSFMIKRWNFRKNRAAFFETGHSEAGKRGESGILSSNTTFTTFTSFRSPPAKKSWVKLSYFLCEGHFSSRGLTWVFQPLSQNCRNAATNIPKPCASRSPVLRIKNQLTETQRPKSATFRLWSRCVSSCVLSATRQAIEVVVCGEMLRRCGFFLRGVEWNAPQNQAPWIASE
jgi:hypothetical protein